MATHLSTKMASQTPSYAPSMRDAEIDLRTLLATLGDHKRLILVGTALFALMAVFMGVVYWIIRDFGDAPRASAILGRPLPGPDDP